MMKKKIAVRSPTIGQIGPCMLMLLVCACVSQAESGLPASQSMHFVEGLGFGEMKRIADIDGHVHHMEFDETNPSRLIFSVYGSLKSMDGTSISTLVGGGDIPNYLEAKGIAAKFGSITGFTQWNKTCIIAVDNLNHCLRSIQRTDWQTSVFAGSCATSGYKDGTVALFRHPYSVIKDSRLSDRILVSEISGDRIRQVNFLTREVSTLLTYTSIAPIHRPYNIGFDFLGENLIISCDVGILNCDIANKSCSVLVGGSRGRRDGSLKSAQFSVIYDSVPLSKSLILAADSGNNKIRVLNTAADSVSSICKGFSGPAYKPAETCRLQYPQSLVARDGLIYIGGANAIFTIAFSFEHPTPANRSDDKDSVSSCPDDTSVNLQDGQSTAQISFRTPSGDQMTAHRTLGEYFYSYTVENGTECNFTVTVRDGRVRRRLQLEAQYAIKCDDLEDQQVYSLFISSAQLAREIEDFCNGECNEFDHVIDACENDTVTLTWSTDVVLPVGVKEIPSQVLSRISPRLGQDHMLKVFVSNSIPPIIYPKMNEDGNFAKLVLAEFCVDGLKFNLSTGMCL